MLARRDELRVRAIEHELSTVRLDGARLAETVLPAIRELTDLEGVAVYSVRNPTGRWLLDRWDALGVMADAQRRMRGMYERAAAFPAYYNPAAPPAPQRNRVIDALSWVEENAPGTWDVCPTNVEVCTPLGLQHHRQPRALLCDGDALLAWFGGMTLERPTRRQLALLGLLVEPMRRRLIIERQLQEAAYVRSALDAMLDRIGGPAFVIDALGGVHETNRAGRVLLEERARDVRAALADAVAGRANTLVFELIDLRDRTDGPTRIAVLRVSSVETRLQSCVEVCVRRWRLTRRQAQVLDLVVRGLPNATIAAELTCVERTIELHVSALLDRAGVDSRSALVASVLTSAG